jgi:hypothetical protein
VAQHRAIQANATVLKCTLAAAAPVKCPPLVTLRGFHHSSRAPGSARAVRTRPTPEWRVVGFLLRFAAVLLIH